MKLKATLLLLATIIHRNCAQSGLFGSLSTASQNLSASTSLQFSLYQQGQFVASGDYLQFILPQGQGVSFVTSAPLCQINNSNLPIQSCQILTQSEARIYFGTVNTIETTINGSVGTFVNPSSISVVSPIQTTLFSSNGQAKSQTLSSSLSNFQASSLAVDIYSSSTLVGDTGLTLSIVIKPSSTLNSVGSIILKTPEYYNNAANDYFFDASRVNCQNSQINFISCSFSPQSRQLTIKYSFINSQSTSQQITIQATGFKNPVKPGSQGGFFLTTLDNNNFAVGASPEIFLSGVSQPQLLSFVTVGFDSRAQVGKYSSIKLNVGSKQALGQNCFIQINFPSEFTLDNTLTAIDGIGIFQGLSVVRIDQQNRIVQVKACTQVYGAAPQQGTITFRQIKNPSFITSTGSFQVTFGADSNFNMLIASYQQGAFVPDSFFDPGEINNIQIIPKDPNYGALTSYDFNFTPSSDLRSNTGTQIVIDFPSSLIFPQNYCAVVSKSDNVSSSITCSLSGRGKVLLNYVFSNKPTYLGGTPISLSIFGVQNPTSQFDLGTFKMQTFMNVNSTFRLVDSGTNQKPVMAQTGSVQKTREVSATSLVANERDVTYTFSMKFTNPVPSGGSIRISFTDSAMVSNTSLLTNSCYRLDFSNRPTSLVCKATQNQIEVTVSQPAFDSRGLEAGDEFRLQVSPIMNRRDQFEDSIFNIQSFDAKGNQIDKTPVPSNFTIRMTAVGRFGNFSFQFENQINGKLSTYTFAFSPMVLMQGGDVIEFQFPKQIGLPFSGQVPCQGDGRVLIQANCVLVQADTIRIVPTEINYPALGDVLAVTIRNIRNPYSNAPTDYFQNVQLIDNLNRIVAAGLKDPVNVQTSQVSKITGSILTQTPKDPGVLATFTLQFNTNNPVPKTAALQITAPVGVSFNQDTTGCTVITDTFKSNLCRFNGSTVLQIRQAFADQDQDYNGRVEVSFKAYNPPDNTQKTLSLKLEIYTDTSFKYLIDIIDDGLAPKTQCNWPCLTCDALNPDLCTSCPVGSTDPQFLQTGLLKGVQTCKYQCDIGFTYTTENGTKRCIKCDEKCATCLSTQTAQDSKICTSCASRYPYFWPEMQTCFDSFTQCPAGSYQFSKFVCSSCPKECVTCTSPFNCVKCDLNSQTPLRQSGKCVSECSKGKTIVMINGYKECQPCQAPCEECAEGNPSECTKCQSDKRLFKIGSMCYTQCPLGMTEDLVNMECTMCEVGCDSCDPNDPKKCLRCKEGLVFYNGKCQTQCPADQNKSSDGTVCEKRVYPLNKKFLPFPFVFTTTIGFCIALISYLISDRTTLANQSFIAIVTVILQLAIFFEILKGISDEQAVFVAVPIVILIGQAVLNVAFTFTFVFQINDFQFNEYREKNKRTFAIIMLLSLFVNFNIFRLTFCKMFLIQGFSGSATNAVSFFKPLKFYSLLQIAFILVPYLILNMIGAIIAKNAWGENQLQMTMVEICILSFVFVLSILYEYFFQSPRKMLFQPSAENTLFKGLFKAKNQQLAMVAIEADVENSQDSIANLDPIKLQIIQERNDRFAKLEDVIRTVKLLKDKHLNNDFDNIMDVEMGETPERRCDTSFEMALPLGLNDELTINLQRLGKPIPMPIDLNRSYPGLNEIYDGNEKRIELLEYFALQAVTDAENERIFIEKLAVQNRQKDQETMYDGALIENCFFAPKTLADNVTQTILEYKEQGIDPLDLMPISDPDQNQEPDVEPEMERRVNDSDTPGLEDTMMSNRPLMLRPQTQEVATGTEDFLFQQHRQPLKNYLSSNLIVNERDPQMEMTPREHQLSNIIQADPSNGGDLEMIQQYGLATPTSQMTLNMMKADENEEDSFYTSNDTVFDRKPNKQMWLIKADQLKTIILNDIEIARKQKEPYKGLQLRKESTDQSLATDRTLSPIGKTRIDPSIEPSQQSARRYKEEPDDKIEEVPIKEEDYDEIDALFYKNNYPYDENYTVSSIHTSQLESIPLDKSYRDDFTAWMKEAVELNQRTFNVFEVLGNFPLNGEGQIIDREKTIMEANFLDRDGLLVNEKGYFINELTGAIRSKYTFEDLFMPETGSIEDLGELPMPYRLEKFNFNPHKIMGCFDYDSQKRPIFLKNKYKNFTDNHFRPVNQCGFLINEKEDIIDNEGHVRFTHRQLGPRGSLPLLYTYKGQEFDIKDIIGRFAKDDTSKEININFEDGKAVDLDGRVVNATGYLIDSKGNIIDKNNQIIFYFYELLFNEPPKIFQFTEFSIEWIKGCLNKDVTKNPFHDDEFDLIGRRINTMGYLINNDESVIDQHGKEVFKGEILTKMYGQDAQIPEVFRSGKLRRPLNWSSVQDQAWKVPKALELNQIELSNFKMNSEQSKASFENTAYKTESQLNIPTELTKKQFTGSIAVTSENSNRSQIKQPPSPLQLTNIQITKFGDNAKQQKQAKSENKKGKK